MKAFLNALHIAAAALLLLVAPAHAGGLTSLGNKLTTAVSDLPRYEKLPLFDPHRKDFTCIYEAQRVPPLDPQAEMWFQQALALDDPNVPIDNIDYAKMYQMYMQAAERNHWRAMLNLASLILSDHPGVPNHDPEAAIRWVEKAMKLGVPDAYDMMGVYHRNGMVKGGGATSAYAFFQRAADMGSPSAQTFLGTKMDGAYDEPGEFWGNLPVATQMLECAFAQGYGDAADELGLIYARGNTTEGKARALKVLHEGVKLGSAKCANSLAPEFRGLDLTDGTNLVGHIDSARAQRYSKLGDALEFYQGRLKLPNLDKVLPLPPAPLPKWDGNVQTLIDGAKAVTPPPKPQQGAALHGREFIPHGYTVSSLEQSTMAVAGDQIVPRDGYWLALYGPASAPKTQLIPARRNTPERYRAGERFEASSFDWPATDKVQWHYLGEAYALPPQREDFLKHMINAGFLREVPEPASPVRCNGKQRCPQTGIWQGRVADDHLMAVLYNRWDRQAFVETMSDLPRYEKLPLFNPHRKTFTCVYQDQHVPPVDPQAELWFQQALALDDPNIYAGKRDYQKIYQLYTQAAERNHWKAMLNLASLILSDSPGVPEHDPEAAIRWVEKAMKLGVPDAYDMMGTYHQNGVIKGGDATSAYAFFQRAADMGSPSAQTFLGYKMAGTYDDPSEGFWGNLPIATQMLECALAQGYGDAAEKLSLIYARPNTLEAKLRALKILHEGVKLGSAKCANSISPEFDGLGLANGRNLVGHIDKARAQRYSKLGDALEFYGGRLKLPNLDKVLPLPPAPLPKWDGDVQTLIDGAKAVTPPPKPQQGAALQGREFIPRGYAVSTLEQSTMAVAGNQIVPRDGYWLALYGPASAPRTQLIPARQNAPERYQAGERFEASSFEWLTADQVQWHYLGEAYALPPQRDDFLKHMIDAGLLREVPEPGSPVRCDGQQRCPQTGIWEGRVADDHPMAALYNRWDRQAFVDKDHAFPQPGGQFIDIAPSDLQWTFLGSPNGDTGMPGILDIRL